MNKSDTLYGNATEDVYSVYHVPFYILYILVGIVSILFHVRFIMIVQYNSSFDKLPAYRILKHGSIACTINILSQIAAQVWTFSSSENLPLTTNSIIGAVFQGSWAVEYPMILILAANRLVAVLLPHSMDHICSTKTASVSVSRNTRDAA
ncbi:unnamed protein product [Heligmosomoides polygyrus]|uniref:7TM_GPCR_Srx domain-containing protein n=1 Tax=Heligmosomoides polygyrus TaxID=6339 RepID=A0A183GKC2_HELPZ|nr:unnamed protein product [Heligmosomoides polygyrus]